MLKNSVFLHNQKVIQAFLSEVPSHYFPEFFSGRVQDEPNKNLFRFRSAYD